MCKSVLFCPYLFVLYPSTLLYLKQLHHFCRVYIHTFLYIFSHYSISISMTFILIIFNHRLELQSQMQASASTSGNTSNIVVSSNTQSLITSASDYVPPSSQQSKPPTLIFALMTLTNILINLDHGILPACTNEMKKHFDMNQTQLGFLGSIVYLGIVLIGTLAGHLYLRFNSKLLTVVALVLLQCTLALFVLSDHKWTAYVSRFLTGSFQVFLLVYYPVWIDKFGKNSKTLWLTLLQICVPVGIFAGYGITAAVLSLGHEYLVSFYIQIALVAAFIIGFALIPKAKLDCRREDDDHEETFMDSIPMMRQSLVDAEIVGPHPQQQIIDQMHKDKAKKKKNKYNYMSMMKKLLKSKMYLVGTLTMSIILFVSTGVQFWLTDYFINVLHFERQRVNIAYAVVSITGPTTGCGYGGYIINRRGGYENPTTVYAVFLFAAVGIGCAVIIPFVNDFYIIVILLWLVLFFGGAMMPGLTGIMMVSVPPYLRAFGNSNGEIIKNILGYLPAPFMYGWFNSMFGERAGIKLIMFWGLWAPFLLALGSVHRFRQIRKKKLQAEKLGLHQPILKNLYSIPSQQSIQSPRKIAHHPKLNEREKDQTQVKVQAQDNSIDEQLKKNEEDDGQYSCQEDEDKQNVEEAGNTKSTEEENPNKQLNI